jgi:hypothetical protein
MRFDQLRCSAPTAYPGTPRTASLSMPDKTSVFPPPSLVTRESFAASR